MVERERDWNLSGLCRSKQGSTVIHSFTTWMNDFLAACIGYRLLSGLNGSLQAGQDGKYGTLHLNLKLEGPTLYMTQTNY